MARAAVEFHPEARAEFLAEIVWYAARNVAAADRFNTELGHTLELIADAPGRWPPHVHGTRRHLVLHFPFAVVYALRGDVVFVVAVAHHRRKPGYWKSRLRVL